MTDGDRQDTPDDRIEDAESLAQQIEAVPSPGAQVTMDQMTDRLQTVIDAAERAAEAIRYDAEAQARQHLAEAQQKADKMTAERVRLIAELTDDLIDHASVVKQHSEQMVGALERAIGSVSGRLEDVASGGEGTAPAPEPAPAAPDPEPFTPYPTPSTPAPAEADLTPEPEPPAAEAEPEPEPELPEPEAAEPEIPEPEPEPEAAREASTVEQPAASEPQPPPEPTPDAEPEAAAAVEDLTDTEPPPEALLRATQLAVAGSDRSDVAEMLTREYGIDPAPVLERIFGPA